MSEDPLQKWAPLIAVTAGWVSSHDEADAKADCIQELAAALRAAQVRVAELEADATLGRLVRDMPRNAKLGHEGQQWGEWYAVWPGDNERYNRQYGLRPEAALEAARKGEG